MGEYLLAHSIVFALFAERVKERLDGRPLGGRDREIVQFELFARRYVAVKRLLATNFGHGDRCSRVSLGSWCMPWREYVDLSQRMMQGMGNFSGRDGAAGCAAQ